MISFQSILFIFRIHSLHLNSPTGAHRGSKINLFDKMPFNRLWFFLFYKRVTYNTFHKGIHVLQNQLIIHVNFSHAAVNILSRIHSEDNLTFFGIGNGLLEL